MASGREEAFFAALALLSQVIPAPLEDAGDDSDDEEDDDVLMEEAEGAGEAALIKASIGLLNDRDFVGNLIGLVERVGGKDKVKGPLPESTAQVFWIQDLSKLCIFSPDCAPPLLRVSPIVDALTHRDAQLRSTLHSRLQALTLSLLLSPISTSPSWSDIMIIIIIISSSDSGSCTLCGTWSPQLCRLPSSPHTPPPSSRC